MVIAALEFSHGGLQGFLAAHVPGNQFDDSRGDLHLRHGAGKSGLELGSGHFTRAQFAAQIRVEIADTQMLDRRSLGGRSFDRRNDGGVNFRGGTLEGSFQISERDFTRAQFAAQVGIPVFRLLRDVFGGLLRQTAHGGVFQASDQHGVITGRLDTAVFKGFKHDLDLVDGLQDQGDHGRRDFQLTVAEFAKQGLAGMRHCFKSRQSKETASPLDGVQQAENIVEDRPVFRVILEAHQFGIDDVQALARFGQEFADEIIHGRPRTVLIPQQPDRAWLTDYWLTRF